MIRRETIPIDVEVLSLVAEIDEFKGRWEALGRLSPETLSSLRHVATIESVGSSTRIEGARLSDAEVEALLAGVGARSLRSRDEEEVAGYAEAMATVFDSWPHIRFDENHIRQLHGILLRHSGKDEAHRGCYKTVPNHVEAIGPDGNSLGVVFETASPFDTPRLMAELVASTREALAERMVHPLLVVGAFVVHFLEIHPFQDGNGRLSRVLTTLLLLQAGYAHVPYASLERLVEENKDGYYRALRASQKGIRTEREELGAWTRFFLRLLVGQKEALRRKIESRRPAVPASALSGRIVALAREWGRLTISDAVGALAVNRNTVKLHLKNLVRDGYLVRHGSGKGSWYSAGFRHGPDPRISPFPADFSGRYD